MFSFRSAKYDANTAISTLAAQMQTTPFWQLPTPGSPTSSPCSTPGISQVTPYQSTDGKEVLRVYNTAMDEIASKISSEREPLTSQLDSWEKVGATQQQHYIQKATEDCMLVCDVIVPNDGKRLFEAMTSGNQEKPDEEAKVNDVMKATHEHI